MEELGITFSFTAEAEKFDKGITEATHRLNTLKSLMKNVNKELKLDPNSIDAYNRKLDMLRASMIYNEKIAKQWADEMKRLDDLGKSSINNEDYIKAQNKYNQATKEVARFKDEIIKTEVAMKKANNVDTSKIYDNLNKIVNKLEEVKSGSEIVAEKLKNLGEIYTSAGKATAGLSGASWAGITKSFNDAKDFESAFIGVMKTVDETTTTTYEDIERTIRQMAQTIPSSASEIANVMEMAGQLGIGADDLEKFTKVMINLGNATNINAVEGAKTLAQLYNITGSDISTVDRFGAAITALGNNTATTEADILSLAQNLAAATTEIGLSDQELLALSATLTSTGLTSEKAGSAMSTIFRNINKEVGNGGKHLAAWAELASNAAGGVELTVEAFEDLWRSNPQEAIMRIVEGLGSLDDKGQNVSATLDDLGVKNIRQIDTLSRLSNAHQKYNANLALANNAWKQNTALAEEASRRYASTESQLQLLKNSITEIGLTLGEVILPLINDLIFDIKPIIKGFGNWVKSNKELVSGLLGTGAAISPLLIALGKGTKGVGNLIDYVSKFNKAQKEAANGGTALLKVLGATGTSGLIAGVGLLAVGIGAAVVKMTLLKNETYQAAKASNIAFKTFNETYNNAIETYNNSSVSIDRLQQTSQKYFDTVVSLNEELSNSNLSEEEAKTKKENLKVAIDNLNSALGFNYLYWDEEKGIVNEAGEEAEITKGKFEELFKTMRVNAWLNSNRQAYEDAITAQSKYSDELSLASKNYVNDIKAIEEAYGITIDRTFESADAVADYVNGLREAGKVGDQWAVVVLEGIWEAQEKLNKTQQRLNEENAKNIEFIEQYERASQGETEAINEVINGKKELFTTYEDEIKYNKIQFDYYKQMQEERVNAGLQESEYYNQKMQYYANELKELSGYTEEYKIDAKERADATKTANDIIEADTKETETNFKKIVDEAETYYNTALEQSKLKNLETQKKIREDALLEFRKTVEDIKAEWGSFNLPSKTLSFVMSGRAVSGVKYDTIPAMTRSGGFGFQSGGYGMNNHIEIHVNNNGEKINSNTVSGWARQLVNEIDLQLGRKFK